MNQQKSASNKQEQRSPDETNSLEFVHAMEKLIVTIQSLSLARSLDDIVAIVCKKARELTGADGATFVLRDGNFCYYVDEDAIATLWKGKRFPMETCISGWVMLNHKPAIIKDIYADPRIPAAAYRPTFVKSLVMVPIRTKSPVGAIGNYWSRMYQPSENQVKLLQALADSTSIAMENVQRYTDLNKHLEAKTQTEEQYRLLAEKLQESLSEKESLLKEIYHRVKNNLQVVSGLLKLQASQAQEPSTKAALATSGSRVQSMSLVHEMLYQSGNLAKVDMKNYISRLSNYLYEIYGVDSKRIHITQDIDELSLKIDTAIPCGLIINEIISNAFKYAFPGGRSGEIKISLKTHHATKELTISDNGVGIPASITIEKANSLGLRLICNLTKQLGGKIALHRENGSTFILTF